MIRTSMAMLLMGMLCFNFVACSDDDEPNGDNGNDTGIVDPSNVFTGERPKSVSGISMVYNTEGLVTGMSTDDGKKVTFEYHNVTRVVNKQSYIRMTVVDEEYDETFIFDMELNEKGFVKHCEQTGQGGDIETWDFGYTDEGNLNYMKRSEGGNEVTNITYQGGNVIKTSTVSEEEPDEKYEYTIYYTSDEVTTPIPNKGCLMLFDATLGIDMDEMEYAYYAGLLGKATKNLPVKDTDSEFSWKLNNNGYPTELVIIEGGYEDKLTFTW